MEELLKQLVKASTAQEAKHQELMGVPNTVWRQHQ